MTRSARWRTVAAVLLVTGWSAPLAVRAGGHELSFAVIGDFGTGSTGQYQLAQAMVRTRERVPYAFVLTVGDNIYGAWSRRAVEQRFEMPYQPLLAAGVSFFASLGNHDEAPERTYPLFNMSGQRYYRMRRANVEFFALDSNYVDAAQLAWLRDALQTSDAPWKIAFFHHPLYSSAGRHGSELDLRALLEPLLVQHRVQIVFTGHDHVYERLKPQHGITYFVCGSSGQLRRGDLRSGSSLTAFGFDQDQAFVLVTIAGDLLHFEAVSRTGAIVDSGDISRSGHDAVSEGVAR